VQLQIQWLAIDEYESTAHYSTIFDAAVPVGISVYCIQINLAASDVQEGVMAEANAVSAMYRRWIGKETVFKASGLGMAGMEIQQFSICSRKGRKLKIVGCSSQLQWKRFFVRQLEMPGGVVDVRLYKCCYTLGIVVMHEHLRINQQPRGLSHAAALA